MTILLRSVRKGLLAFAALAAVTLLGTATAVRAGENDLAFNDHPHFAYSYDSRPTVLDASLAPANTASALTIDTRAPILTNSPRHLGYSPSLTLASGAFVFPEDNLTFSDVDGTLSLNPVPEPSTYLLLALAAIGVWFLRRLRWV